MIYKWINTIQNRLIIILRVVSDQIIFSLQANSTFRKLELDGVLNFLLAEHSNISVATNMTICIVTIFMWSLYFLSLSKTARSS